MDKACLVVLESVGVSEMYRDYPANPGSGLHLPKFKSVDNM